MPNRIIAIPIKMPFLFLFKKLIGKDFFKFLFYFFNPYDFSEFLSINRFEFFG